MPTDEEQLRDWVAQLIVEQKAMLMKVLLEDRDLMRSLRRGLAVNQLRRLSHDRGMNWDEVSEAQREEFLDNMIRQAEVFATQIGSQNVARVPTCDLCGHDLTPAELYRIYFGERPPSIEKAAAKLLILDLEGELQYPLLPEAEITIGRLDPHRGIRPEIDLSRFDPAARISRRHARITARGTQFFIEDLGSANGTFINGRTRLKPQERYPLANGDVLKIGETSLKFVAER